MTVTLAPGRTTGGVVAASQVPAVRRWIANCRQLKGQLEKTTANNRELLRRERRKTLP